MWAALQCGLCDRDMGCDRCASVSLVCNMGGVHCSCCVQLLRCSLSHCRAFGTAPAQWVHKPQWPRGGTLAACVSADGPSPFCRRFEFLQPWHQYNAYYEFKKQFFLQKEGGESAQVRLWLLWPAHYRHRSACSRPWGLWVWPLIAGLMHVVCCLTFPPQS